MTRVCYIIEITDGMMHYAIEMIISTILYYYLPVPFRSTILWWSSNILGIYLILPVLQLVAFQE